MKDSFRELWPYFAATLLIEGAVLGLFRLQWSSRPWASRLRSTTRAEADETTGNWQTDLPVFLGANLLSWPLLHYVWFRWSWPLPPLELGVALLEAIAWRTCTSRSWRESLLLSFVSNATSYLAGICAASC